MIILKGGRKRSPFNKFKSNNAFCFLIYSVFLFIVFVLFKEIIFAVVF